jgi:hypothetical protein
MTAKLSSAYTGLQPKLLRLTSSSSTPIMRGAEGPQISISR